MSDKSIRDSKTWFKVLDPDELPEGRVTSVTCEHLTLCMTRFEGRYGALDNRCPHQGGPLGEGLIADNHPHGCGVLGRSGTPIASWFMNESDCLIVFGASFSNHTGIASKIPTVQVDYDAMTLGKFHAVDVPVWGEIGVTVEMMLDRLPQDELGKISKEQRSGEWDVWQTSLVNPNFSQFAENCGGVGIRVTETEDLESAIRTALDVAGPSLVEIVSDALLV